MEEPLDLSEPLARDSGQHSIDPGGFGSGCYPGFPESPEKSRNRLKRTESWPPHQSSTAEEEHGIFRFSTPDKPGPKPPGSGKPPHFIRGINNNNVADNVSASNPKDLPLNARNAIRYLRITGIFQHYYPEGGWGYVVLTVALIVTVLVHGLQMSFGSLAVQIVRSTTSRPRPRVQGDLGVDLDPDLDLDRVNAAINAGREWKTNNVCFFRLVCLMVRN